ncbi:MAG: hypothetical protein BGO26_15790 [Actinobacteria bacterium 69-20]|nr:hypothetical protein [Actinomycetota bacterium]OJV28763.1 MAG: hypothetical protein BGO26_15790 [Actinobacteria bacterium 69-20]
MRIGASLAVFAIGAILKFAVTDTIRGINLSIVGIILMAIGAVGFVISLILTSTRRRTDVISRVDDGYGHERATRTTYATPNDPDDPRI